VPFPQILQAFAQSFLDEEVASAIDAVT